MDNLIHLKECRTRPDGAMPELGSRPAKVQLPVVRRWQMSGDGLPEQWNGLPRVSSSK